MGNVIWKSTLVLSYSIIICKMNEMTDETHFILHPPLNCFTYCTAFLLCLPCQQHLLCSNTETNPTRVTQTINSTWPYSMDHIPTLLAFSRTVDAWISSELDPKAKMWLRSPFSEEINSCQSHLSFTENLASGHEQKKKKLKKKITFFHAFLKIRGGPDCKSIQTPKRHRLDRQNF